MLQARLDDAETAPNPLPEKFRWPAPAAESGKPLFGRRGWVPLFIGPGPRPEVKDRVVILAYDSSRFEAVDTPLGKIRPHRVFDYALISMYRQLLRS